ncbi:MAG: NADH-quinone oxidoreductase subunit NuoH [Planctomycetota bacterium]|jgi:NADH-quinone oxidoreductase subunit H
MSEWIPDFVTPQLITSVIVILIIVHAMLGASAYLILLERKLSAWMQDRLGPNRVGPRGLLQPIADGLKLFIKEDFLPVHADRTLFIIAPAISAMTGLIAFAVIPWGGVLDLTTIPFAEALGVLDLPEAMQRVKVAAANVNIGVVYLIAVTSLGVYGIVLGGWASNNKFSFLGGMRASAQMISYEIPLGLALLSLILTAGTIRPDVIVAQQLEGQWYLLHQPLAALIFYVCLLAEANRAPFDLAEAEAELVGGWHTEYSSMKWALFFLGEYMHIIVGSAFFAVLFLGGWSLNPFTGWDLPVEGGLLMALLQMGVMFGKVFLMICLTMAIRWTLPRFRFDQLMRLAWEGMIPAGVVILLATSFFVYFGWTPMMWLASVAALVVIWFAYPLLPRQVTPNRRIGLIGSRFSPLPEETAAPLDPSSS